MTFVIGTVLRAHTIANIEDNLSGYKSNRTEKEVTQNDVATFFCGFPYCGSCGNSLSTPSFPGIPSAKGKCG